MHPYCSCKIVSRHGASIHLPVVHDKFPPSAPLVRAQPTRDGAWGKLLAHPPPTTAGRPGHDRRKCVMAFKFVFIAAFSCVESTGRGGTRRKAVAPQGRRRDGRRLTLAWVWFSCRLALRTGSSQTFRVHGQVPVVLTGRLGASVAPLLVNKV
jgi:hypothetical protein